MKKQLRHVKENAGFVIFILITMTLLLLSYVYIYSWRGQSGNIIRSDGWGYYSYLPAIFDYGDLTFSFSDDSAKGAVWEDENHNSINKYPIGTAVMQSPFFNNRHFLQACKSFICKYRAQII